MWGTDFDTLKMALAMPEPKTLKAAYTLHQEVFDPGCRHIPLKHLQQLRGIGTYMATVQPTSQKEFVSVDQLLAQVTPGAPYACPQARPRRYT